MTVSSLKVEFCREDCGSGYATILIRETGAEGLYKAKSRARSLSKSTGNLAYVVGTMPNGESIGHIVYADGYVDSKAGCFA